MFAFIVLTILSGVFDGVYLGSTDYGVIEDLTWWTDKSFSFITIPLVMGSFIKAIPGMITWDYSFFQSLGAFGSIVRVLLFATISIGFVWGFFAVLLPVGIQIVASMIRGLVGLFRGF